MNLPKSLIYLLLASTLFTSCSKDQETAQPQLTPFNAFPSRIGATWVYEVKTAQSPNTLEHTESVIGDTTFVNNSNGYKIVGLFQLGNKTSESYFHISPSTRDVLVRSYLTSDPESYLESSLQLGNVYAGKKWSHKVLIGTQPFDSLDAKIDYVIDSVGLTRTIKGITYSNVIRVTNTFSNNAGQSSKNIAYYSNNVGNILTLVYNSNGFLTYSRELKSFTP